MGYTKNAPLTAAVESDIVGYTTIEMKADKWYQVAFPFVQLDDTETVSISEAFNSGFVDGDTLMILNPQTGLYENRAFWVSEANEGQGAWCDKPVLAIAKPVDILLTPGQAVFILKVSAGIGTVIAQ